MPFSPVDEARLKTVADNIGKLGNIESAIDLSGPVSEIGGAINDLLGGGGLDIGKVVEDVLKAFFQANADIFKDLFKRVAQLIKDAPDGILKILAQIFTEIIEIFSDGGILEPLLKALAKLLKAVVDIFSGAGKSILKEILTALEKFFKVVVDLLGELGDLLTRFVEVVQKLLGLVVDVLVGFFEKVFGSDVLDALPFSMKSGPLDALEGLWELGQLLAAIGQERVDRTVQRIDLVANSLQELLKIVAPNEGGSEIDFIFKKLVTEPTKFVRKVILDSGSTPDFKKHLKDFVLESLDPTDAVRDISKALTISSFMNWVQFPGGIPIGKLHEWLNSRSTYLPKSDLTKPIDLAERQYRARLIAELDSYVRRRSADVGNGQVLTRIDERDSTGILIDIITIFFDTSITFALEPECYPQVDADWDNFEDIGGNLGQLVGRPLRAAIKASIGSVLRGFWAWNVYNKNIIEGIPAIVGSIFTPIVEGLIRNVAFSIEVLSVYPKGAYADAQLVDSFELHRWTSLDAVGNSPDPSERLEYVALIRHARTNSDLTLTQKNALGQLNQSWNTGSVAHSHLKGLIEDLGAYLDVSYQRFRVDALFPELTIEAAPDIEPYDNVSIVHHSFDRSTQSLTVVVRTDAQAVQPRPVLRLYHPCGVIVLTPERRDYKATFKVPSFRRSLPITVLSNRGGKYTKKLSWSPN